MATQQTPQTLIVKLHHGTEIRRFTTTSHLNWAQLSERLTMLDGATKNDRKLTYIDDEKDVITISKDDELQEAIGLALLSTPAVLRLTLAGPTVAEAPKPNVEAAQTRDAANNTTADESAPATGETPRPSAALPPGVPAELAPFLDSLAKQLPAAMAAMPEALKSFLPRAELDLAATIAANAPGAADGVPADPYCTAEPHAPNATQGVHDGVTCDKSGMKPIVGNRYHLVGHNYDLCEAEFDKLSDREKALFRKVPPPAAKTNGSAATTAPTNNPNNPNQIHPGVECDKSGMSPIVGTRFHLRGHNYDLCQAEFDKLPASEKLLYDAVPPPALPSGGPWRGGPWGWRAAGPGGGGGMGRGGMGRGGECGPKLAARFVRDVTIFDGTQMAPGTSFTKIWRLKNVGEVPWPPGTRMLFVGGDQMTQEMSVPLSRASAVAPGEEVDVAVEMVAPKEHGRYLGYWRLTGPHMRRKFGQRVWCHVQVVDPSMQAIEAFDEGVIAAIEKKKSDLAAGEADGDDAETDKDDKDDKDEAAAPAAGDAGAPITAAAVVAAVEDASAAAAAPAAAPVGPDLTDLTDPTPPAAAEETKDGNASDDGVLVDIADKSPTADMAAKNAPAVAAAVPGPSAPPAGVRAELAAMGFTDPAMVECVVAKNGEDVEACARDLAAATEWDHLLDDLAEMGFANRDLNMSLMLKNSGNLKRTVKDLVEA